MAVLRGGLLTFKQEAIGTVDSVNKTFTTSFKFIADSLQVQLNGLELFVNNDYTILTDQSFEFTNATIGGVNPDIITTLYQRL